MQTQIVFETSKTFSNLELWSKYSNILEALLDRFGDCDIFILGYDILLQSFDRACWRVFNIRGMGLLLLSLFNKRLAEQLTCRRYIAIIRDIHLF